MYKTLLVLKDNELLTTLRRLSVWGGATEFEITYVTDNGLKAYESLKKTRYDLVITEVELPGMDGLQLLRKSKNEGLSAHMVLCSRKESFYYARQGIIWGAFDYLVPPFNMNELVPMLNRIKNEENGNEALKVYYAEEITDCFERHDEGIYEYVSGMIKKIYKDNADKSKADELIKKIYTKTVNYIFNNNEWLDLYLTHDDYFSDNNSDDDIGKYYYDLLGKLFKEYNRLFPYVNNDKIKEVILYILNNPESDLKQKDIAAKHYMNSSYLSTVFAAQTGSRFIDYLTTVRLKRAAWLLTNTLMMVTDISTRLDYKDIGYFSRIFKKHYGMTPTEYRIPDTYDYQI